MPFRGWMFLLVPAHPGCPGQIPQSRKAVVCVCVCVIMPFNAPWCIPTVTSTLLQLPLTVLTTVLASVNTDMTADTGHSSTHILSLLSECCQKLFLLHKTKTELFSFISEMFLHLSYNKNGICQQNLPTFSASLEGPRTCHWRGV